MPRRTAPRGGGLGALLLAGLAAACGSTPGRAPEQTLLTPVVRFTEDPAIVRPETGLDFGGHVTIAGESRPVLSASRSVSLLLTSENLPSEGTRSYRVALPEALRAAPRVLVEPAIERDNRWDRQTVALVRPAIDGSSFDVALRFGGVRPGKATRVQVTARAAPDLATRDVVTGKIAVPAGAVLEFAAGVEEPAWTADSPPLELTVTALDGDHETSLYRRRVHPGGVESDRRWIGEHLDLGTLAGRIVRLRFAARAADGADAAISLPVWADPILLAPRPRARPNVLVVSLDTLRAASVSTYGRERETTPALTALVAARGVVFEHAIAPYPHTLPSHMSMFTSLYHRTHGVRFLGEVLAPGLPTLPEALRAAGYETAAFTEDAFLVAEAGFQRGFSLYVENKSGDFHHPAGGAAETFDRGLVWLGEHADRPVLLFLHTYQVHWPYLPPPAYAARFADKEAIAAALARLGEAPPTPEAEGEMRQLLQDINGRLPYEQEVRYTDDLLRGALEHLDRLGLADDTLVIVTADHGEEFLEHGQRYHGRQLYDETLWVPLVMRLPGVLPEGRRVAELVSHVDLAPTVLELLGLPSLEGAEGVSLVPLLRGPAAHLARRAVFAEASTDDRGTDVVAVRTLAEKCILRIPVAAWECFDLRADPEERHALAPDASPEFVRARELLDAFRAASAAEPAPRPTTGIDPEREQKLRALGYTD
jgi:arylsulfatase A-like enzyme